MTVAVPVWVLILIAGLFGLVCAIAAIALKSFWDVEAALDAKREQARKALHFIDRPTEP